MNAQGRGYENALQATLYGGHEAISKLLIYKGADVNAQGGYYRNALQAALKGGHEAIAMLLAEKQEVSAPLILHIESPRRMVGVTG